MGTYVKSYHSPHVSTCEIWIEYQRLSNKLRNQICSCMEQPCTSRILTQGRFDVWPVYGLILGTSGMIIRFACLLLTSHPRSSTTTGCLAQATTHGIHYGCAQTSMGLLLRLSSDFCEAILSKKGRQGKSPSTWTLQGWWKASALYKYRVIIVIIHRYSLNQASLLSTTGWVEHFNYRNSINPINLLFQYLYPRHV